AVLKEAYEAVPVIEPVADRFGAGALLRDGDQPALEPRLEVLDQWLRLGLSDGAALFGAAPADPALDGVERRDPFERLVGDRGRDKPGRYRRTGVASAPSRRRASPGRHRAS